MAKENFISKQLADKPDWQLALEVAGGLLAGSITTALLEKILASRPNIASLVNAILGVNVAAWTKPVWLKAAGGAHAVAGIKDGIKMFAPEPIANIPGLTGMGRGGRRGRRRLGQPTQTAFPVVTEEQGFGMMGPVPTRALNQFNMY